MTASEDSAATTADAARAGLAAAEAHRMAGRWRDAVVAYREALSCRPDSVEALIGLGESLQETGAIDDAVSALEPAIHRHPESAAIHYSLGCVYRRAGRLREAIDLHKTALRLDPHHADALNSVGLFFSARGELEDGIAFFRRALAARPDFPDALVNLGLNLKLLGQYEPALLQFQQAVRVDPDYARAHWAEAQLRLLLGQFEAGWRGYEWRWRMREESACRGRLFPQPAWDGSPLQEGKLLVWSEQGVGDEIMFASLLPELSKRLDCVLECDPRLIPLFARALPDIELVARTDRPSPRLSAPDIHAQTAAGSLGRWLRPDCARFTGHGGAYLRADDAKRDRCRARYGRDKLNVGIAWHTIRNEPTAQRRFKLQALLPILRVPGARFISVQYGDHRQEIATLKAETGIELLQDPEIDQLESLDDFAAQLAALDLVVSIDSIIAHMTGALGLPGWILLPQPPEWRWLIDGEACPWWPSLRLFRQKIWGRWVGAIAEVEQALRARIASGGPQGGAA
jgi:Flp pilus assembly protein TadD